MKDTNVKHNVVLGEPAFGRVVDIENYYVPVYTNSQDNKELLAVCFGYSPEEALTYAKLMLTVKDIVEREKKLEVLITKVHKAIVSDFEHGIKMLNEIAAAEFKIKYPAISKLLTEMLKIDENATQHKDHIKSV